MVRQGTYLDAFKSYGEARNLLRRFQKEKQENSSFYYVVHAVGCNRTNNKKNLGRDNSLLETYLLPTTSTIDKLESSTTTEDNDQGLNEINYKDKKPKHSISNNRELCS